MRILDQNGNELDPGSVDYEKGHLEGDRLFIRHHEAVEAVEEVFHYEYVVYPNGGRDRDKVIDIPAVEAADAWDEYEDILRYVPYTEEELEERRKAEERQARLDALLDSGVTWDDLAAALMEGVNSI